MTSQDSLFPLFTDISMSTADAVAIVAALKDIAESDGTHEDELRMIEGFVEMLEVDFDVHAARDPMTPEKLASALVDPKLRTIAVQCAVLLAWADGEITEKERARVVGYANALGVTQSDYETIESGITAWVKSGDFAPVMSV